MTSRRFPLLRPAAAVLVLAAGLGCALHKANDLYDTGDYEGAHEAYRRVLQEDPSNVKARIGLERTAQLASEAHVERARSLEAHGSNEAEVKAELEKALVLNLNNQIAQDWLLRIKEKEDRAKAQQQTLEEQQEASDQNGALQINPRSIEGLDLTFTRRTSLREIFSTLAKASGVNILLHTSFQDTSVSVDLKGLSFQKALDTLMLQNDLFYRVVDRNTIMIFKNTAQNRDQYENQLIKTYYLSYADPQDVRQSLTALLPQMRVFTDKRMNAIIIKAKPLELAVADRVITTLDKAQPEVMVYVQLMEVTESNLAKVGLLPVISPDQDSGVYRLGATTTNLSSTGLNSNTGDLNISRSSIQFLFPSLALDFLKSNGDARLVANPNVRVVSGETGKINIGEKVSTTQSSIALPTGGATGTTGGSTGGIGGIGGISGIGQTSYNYEDVGVKIEVTPRVHFNDEITLKIKASVTTLKAGSTPGRPDLGNRDIETVTRLKDGETAIFGGLLKDEEQKQLQGVWGLTDIPLLGHLLGNTNTNKAKTDVIMTLRCVLVHKPSVTLKDLDAYNPDDAAVKAGPFAPKEAPKAPAKGAAPAQPGGQAPAPAPAAQTQAPAQNPAPASAQDQPQAPPQAQRPPDASDLVFFISPSSASLLPKDKVEATLSVSGGQGLSSGYLDLQVPPGLKLVSVVPGDFLGGGKIQQTAGPNGTVRLSFSRAAAGVDSGILASVTLEAVTSGNQPLLIQGGQFMAGTAPISARWVNALYTVQ
ncbi:MAG TPA: secretin N-terminal domain-containing protein [Holophagaceae bacterium]|nr:secretin N-terminal domain-containing protein [Holophagaceae bacterium]